MNPDERAYLLDYLHDQAALVTEATAAAIASPGDEERLMDVCDELFRMRETLDELGVPYARVDNDTWDRITPASTIRELGLSDSTHHGTGTVPFAVFGLGDGILELRRLASARTGWPNDAICSVSLEHGHRDAPPWLQATVLGPLHQGGSSLDPRPAIASEYLNLLGREFSTVAGLRTETARVLEDLALVAIDLDGQPEPFQLLSEGDTWVALHDLEPDHVLYVLAQGIEPSKVRLERVRDLQPYIVRA